MNPKVFEAIANYIKLIYTDLILPTLIGGGGRTAVPIKLAAVSVFISRLQSEPLKMWGRNCTSDEDCGGTDVCDPENRTCHSPGSGLELDFLATNQSQEIDTNVQKAIKGSLAQYYQIVSRVLAEDPRRLAEVRDLLMRAYVDAQHVACVTPEPAEAGWICSTGKECMDGICVPIPFNVKLVAGCTPRLPPWDEEEPQAV